MHTSNKVAGGHKTPGQNAPQEVYGNLISGPFLQAPLFTGHI